MSDEERLYSGSHSAVEPLTATNIREGILRAHVYPGNGNKIFSMEPCHRLKEGCHHVVWSVGSHILHALPVSAKNTKSLQRDRAVTTLIKSLTTTPLTISVPSQTFEIGQWICTLQERLPGTSLQAAQSTDKTLEGVVQLLKILRSIPQDQAMEAVRYECERPNLKKRVAKALRHWKELEKIGYIKQHLDARQALSVNLLRHLLQSEYKPVLLHGDLSMQHILIDESDGSITGVIDWSDAMLGDPCEDIAGVALSLGAGNAGKVAAEAGYDGHTIARGLLLAKCLAVEDLRELKCGVDKQPPEELLKAQFGMAFDDSHLANEGIFL